MSKQTQDFSAYRSAKSTRPGWATAFIVAAVLFIATIVYVVMAGFTYVAGILGIAVIITLVIAGISALTNARRE